jgi:hypothetical protein
MSVLPRRDEFGRLACCCYINAAKKWSLELVVRQPVRIFTPPLICLSHPAFFKKWSLGVVTLHGLPVIDRLLCC